MQVILAADVVYDDDSTAALCAMLLRLLVLRRRQRAIGNPTASDSCSAASQADNSPGRGAATRAQGHAASHGREPLVVMALEKRIAFTLAERTAHAPAFDAFLRCMRHGECGGHRLAARELDVYAVPQVFSYPRGHDLVLLELHLDDACSAA